MITSANQSTAGALGRYITREAIATFKKNTYFYDMGKKKMLPKGQATFAFPVINATALTVANALVANEGVTPAETAFNYLMIDVTPKQYITYATITDVAIKDAPIEIITEAAQELGKRFGYVIDTVVQEEILTTVNTSNTNRLYGGTKTSIGALTASDVATSAKFAQITGLLRGNSAPYFDGNSYVAVVHPHVLKDLLTETGNVGFFEASKYSQPENLFNGEVGKIFGVRFVESANVKILVNDGDANVDVYPTYVMGKEAYGVVIAEDTQAFVKPVGSSGSADPANQRGSIAFKSRFGVKMLKEESLYVLYSASSIGDNA